MIRSLQETALGLGRLTLRPESNEETAELACVCPKELPAGARTRYEWNDKGHLVLISELDPDFKKQLAPPDTKGPPGFRPVPTAGQLADTRMDDLITRAAELGVAHKPGETKAALIAKMLPAWEKANAAASAAAAVKD